MSVDAVYAAIPHRPPMLLVDEVIEQDQQHIECRKTFREDEFFFQGHYPGYPIVPGVILCEAAMQAGAILLAPLIADSDEGVPVATRMSDVKFRRMIRPGDQVEMHVQLTERLANAFFLKARVLCGGKVAVRLDFACTVARMI